MRRVWLFVFALLAVPGPAGAQGFDPRPVLGMLISAFQNCGPPMAYQSLSPLLFQTVAAQTGGMGCYAPIRAAGPVLGMAVTDQRQFPSGPLFVVRVTHQAGQVDWYIGFNQLTGKVEYLTFQSAQAQPPTISSGPSPGTSSGPSTGSAPPANPDPKGTGDAGCSLYPAMCQ